MSLRSVSKKATPVKGPVALRPLPDPTDRENAIVLLSLAVGDVHDQIDFLLRELAGLAQVKDDSGCLEEFITRVLAAVGHVRLNVDHVEGHVKRLHDREKEGAS